MRHEKLNEHYTRLWGQPSRTASFHLRDRSVDVWKWDADKNPEQVNIYVTLGASQEPAPGHDANHRFEFFTGLKPAQDAIAGPLAMLGFEATLNRVELGHGHSVTFPEPLWAGTQMRSFFLIRPLVEIVPTLLESDGLHIEFLQAIPVFESEVTYKAEHKAEALLDRWRAASVPFWDPNRSPVPFATN